MLLLISLWILRAIFFLFYFTGNLPSPKIVDRGETLECVSLYVSNSKSVWWVDHPQLIKGKNYTVETIKNQTHEPIIDKYNKLKLKFLNPKDEIFKHFHQVLDDVRRKTLCYYLTFECGAKYDEEILLHKSNMTVDFKGMLLERFFIIFCVPNNGIAPAYINILFKVDKLGCIIQIFYIYCSFFTVFLKLYFYMYLIHTCSFDSSNNYTIFPFQNVYYFYQCFQCLSYLDCLPLEL